MTELSLVEEDAPSAGDETALRRPPFLFAKRHGVLVAGKQDGRVIVMHRADTDALALVELRRFMQHPLTLQLIDDEHFKNMLAGAYEQDSSEAMQMMGDLGEDMDLFSIAQQLPEPEDLLESEDDAPIIRLINALLTEAVKENASDIHIEPFENRLVVRFRVDGVLREVLEPQRVLAPLLVSRIKVMARLDIAEKRLPQDGRISLRVAGRAVDVRVSTLPSGNGERVVLRLLDKRAGRLDLEHLGMASPTRNVIDGMINKPHGIILVTGPTGSGKTTTLYAALERLNNKRRNIMTVEDPIEFVHESKKCLINQREVHRDTHGFNEALRSALREDPDIILVGEMRDLETIRLALTAAETGHLVFGTLHTSSAAKTIDRIIDVFPAAEKTMVRSMLSESLRAVIAQTLMKKIGGGRIAGWEIMIGTPAIRNLIREDKVAQMYSSIQTGQAHGMITMDQYLQDLTSRGLVTIQDARAKAVSKESFQ